MAAKSISAVLTVSSVPQTSKCVTTSITDPGFWSPGKRWTTVIIYCVYATVALLLSSLYGGAIPLIMAKYHVSSVQLVTLGLSMNVVGNLFGVAVLGPTSDVFGRKWVFVFSIFTYGIFNLGNAYARNLAMLIVFQFLAGFAVSAALTNVAAVVSDLFPEADNAAQPMSLFVAAGTVGPTLGSIASARMVEDGVALKWFFLVAVITGVALAGFLAFVPETNPDRNHQAELGALNTIQVLKQLSERQESAPSSLSWARRLLFCFTEAFYLLFTEPIIFLLGLYNGIANGVLLLVITGIAITFIEKGVSSNTTQLYELTYIVGVVVLVLITPLQTWLYRDDRRRHNGLARPEARFLLLVPLILLFPASILWSAFTSTPGYSPWYQVVGGGVVALVDSLLYLAQLNYIADRYPNLSGSAIAGFLLWSFPFQAGLAHAGGPMYNALGTQWGLGLLGFVALGFITPGFIVIFLFASKLRVRARAVGGVQDL